MFCPLIRDPLLSIDKLYTFVFSSLFLILLSGCGTMKEGTPVIDKHAKRGYNKPYTIKGTTYSPQKEYEYSEEGIASYYGGRDVFHGRNTSTGEQFHKDGLTAAHKTLPIPSVVRVTNLENGRTLKMLINDRGPFVRGRIIDVSEKAARLLDFYRAGTARVRVECEVPESKTLAAKYHPKKTHPYCEQETRGKGATLSQAMGKVFKDVANGDKKSKSGKDDKKAKGFKTYDHLPGLGPVKALKKGLYLNIGSYGDQIGAQNFAYKVSSRMRTPCHLTKAGKRGKETYRVMMGPFATQKKAQKMMKELKVRNVQKATLVVQK